MSTTRKRTSVKRTESVSDQQKCLESFIKNPKAKEYKSKAKCESELPAFYELDKDLVVLNAQYIFSIESFEQPKPSFSFFGDANNQPTPSGSSERAVLLNSDEKLPQLDTKVWRPQNR